MKMFIVAAAVAVSTLAASAAQAQAQGVGVYGEVGVNIRSAPNVYGDGMVVPAAPYRDGARLARRARCLPGYQFYRAKGECIEVHEPVFVESAACTPGATRQVPDPARPGGFRIQRCM